MILQIKKGAGRSLPGKDQVLYLNPKAEYFRILRIDNLTILPDIFGKNKFIFFTIDKFSIQRATPPFFFGFRLKSLAVGLARKNPGILPPGFSPQRRGRGF